MAVAGLNGAASGMFDFVNTNQGLGNTSGSYGSASAILDPGLDFCVMKYNAKASYQIAGSSQSDRVFNGNQFSWPLAAMKADSRPDSTPFTQVTH